MDKMIQDFLVISALAVFDVLFIITYLVCIIAKKRKRKTKKPDKRKLNPLDIYEELGV